MCGCEAVGQIRSDVCGLSEDSTWYPDGLAFYQPVVELQYIKSSNRQNSATNPV